VQALQARLSQTGSLEAFRLDYQPVGHLESSDNVLFAEALLRFAGAPPLEVLALAEKHGLLYPLSKLILLTALAQAAQPGSKVSVNLSPAQLAHPALLEDIQSTLRQYGLPGSRLVVEITEAAAAENTCIKEVVRELRQLGVQVWLDDFGSGHSSLERLIELPIDGLKLSHGFTRSLSTFCVNMDETPTPLEISIEGGDT
jgi:EAL domain-containing protein (putative c-di-GMP-specific phosphodiesterase class I)